MTTRRAAWIAAAALAAAAIVLPGCENSPLSAGKDFKITLIAQPGAVVIDPANNINEGTSTLLATVLDGNSVPQQGITVYFSANGGSLSSGAHGVKTSGAGIATDVLTVGANDPASITVTATSASISGTATVTKTAVAGNRPPSVLIVASPQNTQASGGAVVFDGSGSSDPDTGQFITMYKWVITSTNPDVGKPNPIIAEGPGVSGVSIPNDAITAFQNAQGLTVTLLATDDPTAPATFAAGQPVAYRAQQTINYTITGCANTAPTAVIAGPATQQIIGGAGSLATVQLDGSLSTDAETPIDTYTWNCGNGSIPQVVPPARAVCSYLVDGVQRTYTVTLVVTDRGNGQIVNGQYQCVKQSTPATIQLLVTPQAGG
ncbi:MAG TPA: hypothetical protein VFV19_02335 [Candidatus Polarisedimenticolaceae bacterium]|nr:hypothetical protein [Candidatus Polarisedimenticolaceae bacterium]